MTIPLSELRKAYHKILQFEFSKYEKTKKLEDAYTTLSELQNELRLSDKLIEELNRLGFIIPIGNIYFRSLLMDIAFRIADIRIKYGGTKYVLESDLTLKKRPFLKWDYLKFNENEEKLKNIKNAFLKIVPQDIIDNFLEALTLAGIKGLSKYQFLSIEEILNNEKDAIISAPTAFGKTHIFIIPILLAALRAKIKEQKGTVAVIFYPRKSLGSDQMGRLIKLIYYINKKCNVQLSIGIDDGDVKTRNEIKDGEEFRGIKCPMHIEESLIIKNKKIFCKKCNDFLDFICLTREDFISKPPTILITNIWAYQYRLSDRRYWKNNYLSPNIEFFVFDEIHAYRSIVAGVLRYFIQILRTLVSNKARLILSSATIPKLEEFVQDLTGRDISNFLQLIYDEHFHGKDSEKIELYLLLGINPLTSWETYTHEAAIFLCTANRIRTNKNLQSLIFVDSIRNISRLHTQTYEAIELGDPEDHLLSNITPDNPFCYWVYNEEYKLDNNSNDKIDKLREEVKNNIEMHFSEKADKFEIEKRIKEGSIDVVYTTSTLELGVDYDKVSVIMNIGIPFALESIIQRVGRAGRSEDNTLHSSLCAIVIRNNPLEYFYIYKGVEELIELDKLPRIPVSSSNLFVIFYSMLIYTMAYLVKNGKEFGKEKDLINDIEILTKNVSNLKNKIVNDLGIKMDTSKMETKLNEIVKLLKEPNLLDRLNAIKSYREKRWLLSEFENDIIKLKEQLSEMKEKIEQLSENEKLFFSEKISDIEEKIEGWNQSLGLSETVKIVYKIIKDIDDIKNRIQSKLHPMHNFRRLLNDFSRKFDERYREELENFTEIEEMHDIDREDFSVYYRAEEVHKRLQENLISLIESVIGFKFMGNEFIDHPVIVGGELQSPTEKKEEFINNVISRTPPFELVTIPFENIEQAKITKTVGARHFWLIKPTRNFDAEPRKYYYDIKENYLGKGKVDRIKDLIIPQEINFIDLLTLEEPLLIHMETKDGKSLYIKYGSKKILETKIDGKYPIYNNVKKMYLPDEHFNIIRERTLRSLLNIHDSLQRKGNKWGINFRYPSLCSLGYCISVDPFDDECPIKEKCSLCDGKKFWSAARYKRKIFPKFHLSLNVRNLPHIEKPLFYSLQTITYDELKEDVEFVYDSVNVYLPRLFTDYLLREIEIAPLGYLARTSLISLSFNNSLLQLYINKILEDAELLELLKFKYFLLQRFKKLASALDAAMEYEKYNALTIDVNNNEFYKFVEESLIHTLAHTFFLFLITEKVQIDPEKITYFIKDYNIFILENSKNNGMGFVETIKNEINAKSHESIFEEFKNWTIKFLMNHNEHMDKYQDTLLKEARNSFEILKTNKKIIELRESIIKLNENINKHIKLDHVDIITYRHILSQKLSDWEEYEDYLSEYILPLVHLEEVPKLCVDGCDECLIFYRGCTKPFEQHYLISKQIALKFFTLLGKGHLSRIGKGLGKIIVDLMENSNKIIIKTPFIDEYGYNLLIKLKNEGKNIKVITRRDNPYVHKLLESGINLQTTDHFHTKLYYLENKTDKICIHGSINLTYQGFNENEENLVIVWDPLEVSKIKKELE
ncbi:MAG: DEAD/DEAH box helicase [Nitrososphaeria archaeon]